MFPAIIDLRAIWANSLLFLEASELSVAIWMAIEPKLEKPQMAYVATIILFSCCVLFEKKKAAFGNNIVQNKK